MRRAKANELLWNAIIVYPILLVCIWYWTPSNVLFALGWLWEWIIVARDWIWTYVEWALDCVIVAVEVFLWLFVSAWAVATWWLSFFVTFKPLTATDVLTETQ